MTKDLYKDRLFSLGYPRLVTLGSDYYSGHEPVYSEIPELLLSLEKLIELWTPPHTVAVIGCGPRPQAVIDLLEAGFNAVGVEPIAENAARPAAFVGNTSRIVLGMTEDLPIKDASQKLVVMNSVLEHVDSPPLALAECNRVLVPGGVLFVHTTNRFRISLTGNNMEFRVPFFNWLPGVVKESYVFKHLHYDPVLANYAPRPAVHWFSFPDLCTLGRNAGFGQFYSRLDLIDPSSPSICRSALRRFLVTKLGAPVRRSPWLRALTLLQLGGTIFMLKRPG
jgi:SAM-dependent methyltransferase